MNDYKAYTFSLDLLNRKRKIRNFVFNIPLSLSVKNSKELSNKIENFIKLDSRKNYQIKSYDKLIYYYLGDVKKAPINMRKFISI